MAESEQGAEEDLEAPKRTRLCARVVHTGVRAALSNTRATDAVSPVLPGHATHGHPGHPDCAPSPIVGKIERSLWCCGVEEREHGRAHEEGGSREKRSA